MCLAQIQALGLTAVSEAVPDVAFGPFQWDHADALLSWAQTRDDLLQWSGPHFTFPLDREQLRDYASSACNSRWLVSGIDTSTGAVVAHAELNILPDHHLGQIRRVAVAPSARGQRIGTSLMDWLVGFAFTELRLHRLELVVFSFNEPARRCYAAAGFVEEGYAHHARKGTDGSWDLVYMAVLAE